MSEHDTKHQIRELIPRTNSMREYYEATDRKHFLHNPNNSNPVGSQFTDPNIQTLEDLLTLAATQRTCNLDGDDRELFLNFGAEQEAFKEGIRYLLVRTSGIVGIISSTEIENTTGITILQTKPNTPPSLTIAGHPKPETNIGTIIIGRNWETRKTTQEILYTAHPGLPIPTYENLALHQHINNTLPLGELKNYLDEKNSGSKSEKTNTANLNLYEPAQDFQKTQQE